MILSIRRCAGFFAFAFAASAALAATPGGTNVLTYHYDALRTGWDQTETTLTPGNVGGGGFGLLAQVPLDEQVDAQPLFVSNQQINGAAHDVVYVATENNSIYAIDAATSSVLLQQNYGKAVPISRLYGQCNNNSDNMGINSTPVIDQSTNTLYAITYALVANVPTFQVHAIDLTTLADQVAPVTITASGSLTNGRTYNFDAHHHRQRAALLELNGAIYAGFSSWCDYDAKTSRGWVMGWNTGTLAPLAGPKLFNQLAKTPRNFFLTSVWMSGYGIASDGTSLYFTTGNSDPEGTSYNSSTNLDESVVKLSADLGTVQDYFTPDDAEYGWSQLDREDGDFTGGGVLLLPDQPGSVPHLAVAAGKFGPMYLFNRDHLGGLGSQNVTLGGYRNNGCWCGQSYYTGADGIGRVVESTGDYAIVWTVKTNAKKNPRLVRESASPHLQDMQDPGFFTSISSNGTTANSQIIWAVERPYDPVTDNVSLVAFDPSNGSTEIFSAVAGTWPFAAHSNANLVPVVANGHVFVASYKNLSEFGLAGGGVRRIAFRAPPPPPVLGLPPGVKHELFGIVTKFTRFGLTLRLRDGKLVKVDTTTAQGAYTMAPLVVGHAFDVRGNYNGTVLVATTIARQKENTLTWGPDQ